MANRVNPNLRLIIAAALLGRLFAPAALAVDYNDFPTDLQMILDERIAALDTEGGMCIAGRVTFGDAALITSGADVMVNLYHEGLDEPMWVYEGGWFIMGRVGSSAYAGADKGFVLRAFGYDPVDASAMVLDGEMTYLEFEMTKTPPENLANIERSVYDGSGSPWPSTWLASVSIYFPFANHGTGTYPYMSTYASYTVGHGGAVFSFEDLSVCEHEVMATAEGYDYDTALVTPPAVWPESGSLKIYPNRAIIIDYVYQADGSRDFTGGNLQMGTIEWLNGSGGVDFSRGQVVVGDGQDLSMVQEADILRFEAIEPNGLNGFYDAGLVDFDSVLGAAETGYSIDSQLSKVGHVYVARTGEGNYAKFIIQSFETAKRWFPASDPFRGWAPPVVDFGGFGLFLSWYCGAPFDPCDLPEWPAPDCDEPDVVMVRHFCGTTRGLEGTLLPYIWQVDGWAGTVEGPIVMIRIVLTYDEGDVASVGLTEGDLTVFQSPDNGASWDRLETARYASDNTLVVEVERLSWFVVGSESTEILPRVIYVDDDATSVPDPCDPWADPMYYRGDGASWVTAYKYLQDAFESANYGDEIRVAQGTYRPDAFRPFYGWTNDREATFQLINGVSIYGGYAGVGAPDPDERNVELYESILTGDLDDNDGPNWNQGENSYHVVTGSGTEPNAILDGFTITRGLAGEPGTQPNSHGAGIYNVGGSPTIANCKMTKNYARRGAPMYNGSGSNPNITNCRIIDNWGAIKVGMYNEYSDPTVTGCLFSDNLVQYGWGGEGMYNEYSNPIVSDCNFTNNVTGMGNDNSAPIVTGCIFTNNGYGMSNGDSNPIVTNCIFAENTCGMGNWWSNPEVINCTFSDNSNLTDDPETSTGGGMFNYESSPIVTNCQFNENLAYYGGGMFNMHSSEPKLINCTFTGNHARLCGGGICNSRRAQDGPTKPTLNNCTFSNNSAIKDGGGMYSWDSDPNLTDCEFIGNWAKRGGGGMCNDRDSTVSMVNCTFTENSKPIGYSEFGGGGILCLSTSILNMNNCIFTRNSSGYDSGGGGAIHVFDERSLVTAENCRFDTNFAEYGGGILNGGQLSLINCTFTENRSWLGWEGGGAIADGGVLTIDNCIFSKNISRDEEYGYGGFGGAIFCDYSEFKITNSIFVDNTSLCDEDVVIDDIIYTGNGGAVCIFYSSGEIENCLFAGNSSGIGGGLYLEGDWEPGRQVLLNNCTVVGNSSRYYGGGLLLSECIDVTNCIIQDNRAQLGPQVATWAWKDLASRISYCDVQGGEGEVFLLDIWGETSIDWGEGNIDADPCFVQPGWWDPNDDFWVHGDYHLQPTSPCIDVGDNSAVDANSTDFDGNPRIVDGNNDDDPVVDMGAYEYWKYARNLADLNGDGVVDYRDFVILASYWMEENCPVSAWCAGCDINYSGKVDSTDLFRVARSWLWQMETAPDLDLDLDNLWMYQNLPGRTASNLTAAVSIAYDPLGNNNYTYDWEFDLPDDVSIAPAIIDGGGAGDAFCIFAAPGCDQPEGVSDSGQPFSIKVTVTGDDFGNSATAEAQFGIALLGDVNNDAVVNVADRGIINAFWQDGSAGDFTLRDCDLNCDGTVNVADRSIANAIWRGVLGANSVSEACPLR